MMRRSDRQLDHKGLVTGVGSGVSKSGRLPTPTGVGSGVGSSGAAAQKPLLDAESQGLVVTNPEITNPESQGVGSSVSLFRETETTNPARVTSPDGLLTTLCEQRQRLADGMSYLRRHLADDERFSRGRHRLVRIMTDEYLPLLHDLRRVCPPDELRARRDDVERRLTIGWTVDKPGADERFAELVTTYEVLTDALDDDAVSPMLDRVLALEAVAG